MIALATLQNGDWRHEAERLGHPQSNEKEDKFEWGLIVISTLSALLSFMKTLWVTAACCKQHTF